VFARIHAEQRDIATHGFQLLAEIGYRYGLSVLERIWKLLAEEEDLHSIVLQAGGDTKVGNLLGGMAERQKGGMEGFSRGLFP